MNKIFEFLQEDNGGFSSMRVFSAVSILCMAVDWMHAVFTVGVWKPDPSLLALVLGPITAKVVQKRFEEKLPTPVPSQEGNKLVPGFDRGSEIQNLSSTQIGDPKS